MIHFKIKHLHLNLFCPLKYHCADNLESTAFLHLPPTVHACSPLDQSDIHFLIPNRHAADKSNVSFNAEEPSWLLAIPHTL